MSNPYIDHYQQYVGLPITTAPSPFSNWLKGVLREVSAESIVVEFTVREEMTNPVKMLHGGMIAAIIDDMIGMHIFLLGEKSFYFSVNLNIDFLSNVAVGNTVRAQTRIIKKGKRLINAECILLDAENRIMAKGSSNLVSTEGVEYNR